ncbi:TonB-dependent receptor, partial [Aromatoleum toluclasticum]|nr:TonB-dependent receptor [Aromatoleum toluclasticum]
PRYRFVARPYTTSDANITYTTNIAGHTVQLGLTAPNIGPRHQEFADRSQQAASGSNDPVNEVCPTAYLSLCGALARGKRP